MIVTKPVNLFALRLLRRLVIVLCASFLSFFFNDTSTFHEPDQFDFSLPLFPPLCGAATCRPPPFLFFFFPSPGQYALPSEKVFHELCEGANPTLALLSPESRFRLFLSPPPLLFFFFRDKEQARRPLSLDPQPRSGKAAFVLPFFLFRTCTRSAGLLFPPPLENERK